MRIPEGYYAVLFPEWKSETIGVKFPEHPGIVTYGHDMKEAEKNACEALNVALESDFDRRVPLPSSHKPKIKSRERIIFVSIEPAIRMAYLLRAWREKAGFTQKQMAERLQISFQAYQRMERPGRSNLTVATLERIARALDAKLILDLRLPHAA